MMAGGDGGLLDRAWRIIATGISFVAFGLGGLMLWALAFPLLDLGVREMELLTNSPKTIVGLDGYGLTIVGHRPLTSA